MRKLIILIVVTSFTTGLFAQKIGVRGGLNLTSMVIKDNDNDVSDEVKLKPGFHIGAMVELPLKGIFSFETGVLLSSKGLIAVSEYEIGAVNISGRAELSVLHLDLPLTGKANFALNDKTDIYAVFGPYISVGLSGNAVSEITFGEETTREERTANWGKNEEEDDLRRLDYGLVLGGGLEIGVIQIGLSYNLGLANVSADRANGLRGHHHVGMLSVGYQFGNKE